jgi:hypothetical protein
MLPSFTEEEADDCCRYHYQPAEPRKAAHQYEQCSNQRQYEGNQMFACRGVVTFVDVLGSAKTPIADNG